MEADQQAAEVMELSEIVGAFYGIAPKTDSVKRFVERQVWYHPEDGLQRSQLTEGQREALTRLEAIAEKLRVSGKTVRNRSHPGEERGGGLTGVVGLDGGGEVLEAVARLPMAGFHDRQNCLHESDPLDVLRAKRQLPPDHRVLPA